MAETINIGIDLGTTNSVIARASGGEVEILRNESAEKDRKLKEERHNVQRTLTSGKRVKDDINKLEAEVKEKLLKHFAVLFEAELKQKTEI